MIYTHMKKPSKKTVRILIRVILCLCAFEAGLFIGYFLLRYFV